MKRSYQFALLLGVVGLGALYLLQREVAAQRGPNSSTEAPSESLESSRVGSAQSDSSRQGLRSSAVPANPPRIELPPLDVPLAPVLPELVRAARAGDTSAMCRLSFELSRCGGSRDFLRSHYETVTDNVLYSERPPSDYLLKEYDRLTERLAQDDRICAGVVQPADLKSWRLLRDAARAGHVPSMVRFATQFPNERQGSLYDMDALVARRDESIGFLRRAAVAGDAWAAYSLFWGYSGNAGFPTPFQEDSKLALAYALALRDIGDEETAKNVTRVGLRLRRRLSEAEVRDAERLAASLAPGLSHMHGASVDLRRPQYDSAADCGQLNPRSRSMPDKVESNAGAEIRK